MAPKASSSKTPASSSSANALRQIPTLEAALLSNPSDPNPLLHLLGFSRDKSAEVVHKAIWALHRCFVPLISGGKVGGLLSTDLDTAILGSSGDSPDREEGAGSAREVKGWLRGRLAEYIEVLVGLLRDSEAALRTSALPLLFALLPPLSGTVPSGLHTIYFRIILSALLEPQPTLRGASPRPVKTNTASSSSSAKGPSTAETARWMIVPAYQVSEPEGTLPADVMELVVEDFWAKYDDLRWLFFREARHYIENITGSFSAAITANLLGQLLPLTNLPRKPADLNAFYVPSLSTPPSDPSSSAKKAKTGRPAVTAAAAAGGKKAKSSKEAESTPAWMEAYEQDSDSGSELNGDGKRGRERTSKLNILASVHSVPAHVSAYTDLWLAVLGRVQLDPGQGQGDGGEGWSRKILVGLHGSSGILGHMRPDKRVRVADWLGGLVDQGGVKGMLAINGLFVLMTQYNLDYPNFYPRLYSLLTPSLLHTRYRARFFRLLDTFLRSALLPSALIASFIKRLAGLALTAPPGGVVLVLPFVYGLFKRHPGCMGMLQRFDEGEWEDPYDPADPSPFTSKAIDSSLWELASLQNHYLASVSTLSGIFKEQFTKPEFALEDFLDHGYTTMFTTEVERKIKISPALALALELGGDQAAVPFPRAVAGGSGSEAQGEAEGDVVSRFWAF